MREVEVVGVRVEMPTNQPLVLLRELEGDRYLPIWIGAVEARPSDSIALALRSGTRILCAEDVLDVAGIASTRDEDEEIEKFREFLDAVEPEDFEAP